MDVVGRAQAAAHEVVHAQEVGEVGVAVEVGRVVDAEVDAVAAGELGDGRGRRRALDVDVQLDLRQRPDVVVGRAAGVDVSRAAGEQHARRRGRRRRGTPGCASSRPSAAGAGRRRRTSTIVAGRGDITTIASASSTASSIEWVTSSVVVDPLHPDPLQLHVHPLAGHRVEGAERLVEQQHAWAR